MNSINLRKCFSLFATGITSVISKNKKNYVGITVNSFSSVSLDPPLVMWCIDKKSSSLSFFVKKNVEYKIIFLSSNQKKISNQLASPNNTIDKKLYLSIIKNSMGYLNCRLYKKINAGDHFIILHKVKNFKVLKSKKPLIFFKKKYLN